MAPQAHICEYVVPNWWSCLGRIKRSGLDRGGMPLGASLKFQQIPGISVNLSAC